MITFVRETLTVRVDAQSPAEVVAGLDGVRHLLEGRTTAGLDESKGNSQIKVVVNAQGGGAEVGSLRTDVSVCNALGIDIGHLTAKIRDAANSCDELTERQLAMLLGLLNTLEQQANLPQEKRLSATKLRSIIDSVSTLCQGVGGLATVWSVWGSAIGKLFGL